jgi:hypothetical protein
MVTPHAIHDKANRKQGRSGSSHVERGNRKESAIEKGWQADDRFVQPFAACVMPGQTGRA